MFPRGNISVKSPESKGKKPHIWSKAEYFNLSANSPHTGQPGLSPGEDNPPPRL